jgi:mono/diheme cytochrome c family protein
MMNRGLMSLLAAGLLAAGSAACGPTNDAEQTQQEQVVHGSEVYQAECARCHDPGGVAPPLTAPRLAAYGTAQSLYSFTRSTMPQDRPGTLSDQEYWAVTAYTLDQEGLLPGETVLGPDTAGDIGITQ